MYLIHHGVVGMHWGIRRYQNEDGSLTEAGRKRYNQGNFKEFKKQMKSNEILGYNLSRAANEFYKNNDNQKLREKRINRIDTITKAAEKYYDSMNEYDEAKVIYGEDSKKAKSVLSKYEKATNTYNKIVKENQKLNDELKSRAQTFADDFFGKYTTKKIGRSNVPGGRKTAGELFVNELFANDKYAYWDKTGKKPWIY